jgi:hypothetical protein
MIAATGFALLASACDGEGPRRPSPPGTASPSPFALTGWDGPPSPGRNGTIDVGGFNALLDEVQPPWSLSPIRVVLEFLRVQDPQAFRTSIDLTTSAEAFDMATVRLVEDGLLDDSVRAVRYTIEMARGNDLMWRLVAASWDQRCQPRRGHQNFSPELCV